MLPRLSVLRRRLPHRLSVSRRKLDRFSPSMMKAAPNARKKMSRVWRQNFRKYPPAASDAVAMTPSRNPWMISIAQSLSMISP
jgi:hypothetical protein